MEGAVQHEGLGFADFTTKGDEGREADAPAKVLVFFYVLRFCRIFPVARQVVANQSEPRPVPKHIKNPKTYAGASASCPSTQRASPIEADRSL